MAEHLSPEQEARLRRLLARSRHDERVPDDVAEHLDGVLARLEAGDPELVSRRYPKVSISLQATHAHGAPVSLLLVSTATAVPEHTALIVCVYCALYCAMTISVTWGVDGKWPYPFLEQAHAKGGIKQVAIVAAVLSLVHVGIGFAGKAVAAMRLT